MILDLVPDVDTFQMSLRAVKLWAKSKGLYGNMLGFLGGFSWAVLVAKVCMENPQERSIAKMLHKFFGLYADWDWTQPVSHFWPKSLQSYAEFALPGDPRRLQEPPQATAPYRQRRQEPRHQQQSRQ